MSPLKSRKMCHCAEICISVYKLPGVSKHGLQAKPSPFVHSSLAKKGFYIFKGLKKERARKKRAEAHGSPTKPKLFTFCRKSLPDPDLDVEALHPPTSGL